MNEEDVFREAILTEADDHVHRLIYADWLLERDPGREPLVREQGMLGPSLRTGMGQKLVPIPAGSFLMGSPEEEKDRDPDETQHPVTITAPFYLGAGPVSVREFRTFMEDTGYQTEGELGLAIGWNQEEGRWERSGDYSWRNPGWTQSPDEPVVCLSWADAVMFVAWLSAKDNRTYRLPTEAEWEWACRAGSNTPWFFGTTLTPAQANIGPRTSTGSARRLSVVGQTTIPGRYPANAFGLYDMHGNVWEWCSDWYGYGFYSQSRKRDPAGPEHGNGRVLRGGSWYNQARDCRCALRRCGHPSFSRYQDGNTGFRLALSIQRPPKKTRGKRSRGEGNARQQAGSGPTA
jgi:uncharacterized protein (TIGR02996 family)